MRLIKQYCPKHLHFITAKMKPVKRTEVGKQIREKIGKSRMGPIATSCIKETSYNLSLSN